MASVAYDCRMPPEAKERRIEQWQKELWDVVKSPLLGVGVLVGQHVELSWHARPCCEPIERSLSLSVDFNGLWIKPMPCCLFILGAF